MLYKWSTWTGVKTDFGALTKAATFEKFSPTETNMISVKQFVPHFSKYNLFICQTIPFPLISGRVLLFLHSSFTT